MLLFRAILVSLLLFTHLVYGATNTLYILPNSAKPALKALLKSIDHARFRIDGAIYSFTHKEIAKHLAAAAKRGVKIRIIADYSSNAFNRRSQIGYLAKYQNIETWLLKGKPYKKSHRDHALMHMKVMVIDNRRIIFGSANWTYSAFGKNYEILSIVDDYAKAKLLERGFERMLNDAFPY
ncbi:MAG: nuclease NucT [Hydrogenimonas sp.]|nr:MAG: nuclease NucT [Hydrogenimonas sp.]